MKNEELRNKNHRKRDDEPDDTAWREAAYVAFLRDDGEGEHEYDEYGKGVESKSRVISSSSNAQFDCK